MWKHVLVAASFDSAWATTNPVTDFEVAAPLSVPDMDSAQAVATTLVGAGPSVASAHAGVTSGVITAGVVDEVGVSGNLTLSTMNTAAFWQDGGERQLALTTWIAGLFPGLPAGSVAVTLVPPDPTEQTQTAAGPSTGPVAEEPVGGEAVPTSADAAQGDVAATYVVNLSPGKTEIASRLNTKPAADLLQGFTAQLGELVSGVAVRMGDPTDTGVGGTFTLSTTDTSATGIQSIDNQQHIRTAIANVAGVYIGDVSPIQITATNPAEPIAEQPVAPAVAGPNTLNSRRLQVGQVDVNFNIVVPGRAAQGWQKDCSLQKIVPGALSDDAAGGDAQFTTFTDSAGAVQPVSSPGQCAAQASALGAGATVWSWQLSAPGGSAGCTISNNALLSEGTFDSNAITGYTAGADGCGDCPSQLVNPDGWPGADAAASNLAFGSAGQPLNLQCWPKNSNYDLMPCGHQVVESFGGGSAWPGQCNNLETDADAGDQATCQLNCQTDPFCTVWMWGTPNTPPGAEAVCWRGVGNQCWTQAEGASAIGSVIAAERIQHGEVNVIVDGGVLRRRVLSGLQQQFPESVPTLRTAEAQSTACRNICHSNILCQYWQSFFRDGTGNDLGCWIENPGVDATGRNLVLGTYLAYPLTEADFRPNSEEGDEQRLTGGQFIQHHCPIPTLPVRPPATTTTTTTVVVNASPMIPTPAPSGGFMWPWGWLLLGALLITAIAAVAAMMLCQPKAKVKGRGVKPIKKKVEPPPPAVPPPPVVVPLMSPSIMVQPTIAQPLGTMIQPQFTTVAAQAVAQPIQATYAGAPQATYAGAPQFVQRPY